MSESAAKLIKNTIRKTLNSDAVMASRVAQLSLVAAFDSLCLVQKFENYIQVNIPAVHLNLYEVEEIAQS